MDTSTPNLDNLASPDSQTRSRGTIGIFTRARAALTPEHDLLDRFRNVLASEWREVGARREALVPPLVRTLTQEQNLLTIEIAAMALATQGEDGLTALVDVLDHDDFSIRSKAVIGIGLLDRSARWAVPVLTRALSREPVWLVTADLVRALGRIGGQRATDALSTFVRQLEAANPKDDALCEEVVRALAQAQLDEALG